MRQCTLSHSPVFPSMLEMSLWLTGDAASEGEAYAWHVSAVITRFMWDGRNSMLGDCNTNKTQR